MQKTNAFVLRRQDFREYDRIYTLYSDQYGKISLLARGARRIKSKLAPHLEGLNEVRLNFAKGKIFNHLSGANVISLNKGLLCDSEKIAFISDCFHLLDRFIKPEEGDVMIYDLMKEVFVAVSSVIASPSEGVAIPYHFGEIASSMTPRNDKYNKIRVYFFWRLADLLGYRPQLDECALCGKAVGYVPPLPLPPFKGEVPEGRRGMDGIENPDDTPSALWASPPLKSGERKNSKFNITDNIIICSKCVGDGIFIQENSLQSLRKIFQVGLAEFLQTELDNQLLAITEKARQIKLSEL